jgi:glycerol-3-phosphate dehydrogenase (NAD(P)+)
VSKYAVLGAGSWGTTIAKVIADGGHGVTLWARKPELAAEIDATRLNANYLPEIVLPEGIIVSSDVEAALKDSEQVYLAIPSQTLRENLTNWKHLIPKQATIISLMKGLEADTGLRMSEVISEVLELPASQVAVLSGPNLALEIARREPAAAVCACEDSERASEVARVCSSDYFTVFTNQDVMGTELGGVLKNLIAVAIGIVNGLGYGQNTKASIMTRGLGEITNFAIQHGARRRTMFGLAGLGDLIATSESSLSRNFRAGEMLGQGKSGEEVLAAMNQVAEGLGSLRPVLEIAKRLEIEMPIVSQVEDVYQGRMNSSEFGKHLNLADDVEMEF